MALGAPTGVVGVLREEYRLRISSEEVIVDSPSFAASINGTGEVRPCFRKEKDEGKSAKSDNGSLTLKKTSSDLDTAPFR